MHYTGTVWRPPYEAWSALLQVTAGCTHHKCKFCTLYEDIPFKFKMSPIDEIEDDLKELCYFTPDVTRMFLVGANPFVLSTEKLRQIAYLSKYHIVFAPKYRRKVFYESKRLEVGAILRELSKWKDVEIIQAEVCPDHIHMLVSIPPKMSVSSFMGFLKGKSSLMIYERWGDQKFKYKNREFWCKGYYVDTAGKDAVKIKEYIENQLKNNRMGEQLGFIDKADPFTGSKD